MSNEYRSLDFYAKKAQEEGFLARSVYKLQEIQNKFNIIKKNQKIVDLGSAPGSWLQYTSSLIGENGLIIGIDYKKIKVNKSNIKIIEGSFISPENKDEISKYSPFDGIISDMAPDTEGDEYIDSFASSNLVREALDFAYNNLKIGGFFVAKIFQGGEENEIISDMKNAFEITKWFKPKSSRKISVEIFIIGLNFIKKPKSKESTIKDDPLLDQAMETGNMMW